MNDLVAVYKLDIDVYDEEVIVCKFIYKGDDVPDGWTTDRESLETNDGPEELPQVDQIANIELALAEIYEMLLTKGGEE